MRKGLSQQSPHLLSEVSSDKHTERQVYNTKCNACANWPHFESHVPDGFSPPRPLGSTQGTFQQEPWGRAGDWGEDRLVGGPSRGPTAVHTRTRSPGHRHQPPPPNPRAQRQAGREEEREGHAPPSPKNKTYPRNNFKVHCVEDPEAGLGLVFQKGPLARRLLAGIQAPGLWEGVPTVP